MKKLSVKDGNYILTKHELKELYLHVYEIGRQNGVLMDGIGVTDNVQENLNKFMEFQDETRKRKAKKSYAEICPFFNDEDFQIEWEEFYLVRKKKKSSLTERGTNILLKKIMEFSSGKKEAAIEIVKQSYMSGWSTVYELKNKKSDAGVKQSREEIWRNSYQADS